MTSIKDYKCNHSVPLKQFCRECFGCNHSVPADQFCQTCFGSDTGISSIMRKNEAIYTESDMVNEPPHYKVGGTETIDYIQAKLTAEEFTGYCKGNALKYISRANHKKDATEDLRKAVWYLNRLVTPEGN